MFCFKSGKEISEDVGAAAGTTVRHAGLKVAAVILAGVVGGGGVTYGVVKNADKIPVIQNMVIMCIGIWGLMVLWQLPVKEKLRMLQI